MSVSGHFISFTSFCQTVAGISMISQFHEFLSQIFGGFLKFDLTVRVGGGRGFNKGGCTMPRPWGTCWRAGGFCCLG